MDAVAVLTLNAAVLAAAFLLLWGAAVAIRDVSFIDSVWALGMVAMAATTFAQMGEASPRRVLLLAICATWGLRLGGHLFLRWRSHGPDSRYESMFEDAKRERGWGFAKSALLLVFAIQAPFLFVVCLPVQLGQMEGAPTPLGLLAFLGAALAVVGFLFETVGDWQLARFRADPASKGKVLNTGLWRYTRHPNYFGDACVWWGLYLIAAETPLGVWSFVGPAALTWTLLKFSGTPMLEGRLRETRPDYAAYIESTSGFLPWPPKRG